MGHVCFPFTSGPTVGGTNNTCTVTVLAYVEGFPGFMGIASDWKTEEVPPDSPVSDLSVIVVL